MSRRSLHSPLCLLVLLATACGGGGGDGVYTYSPSTPAGLVFRAQGEYQIAQCACDVETGAYPVLGDCLRGQLEFDDAWLECADEVYPEFASDPLAAAYNCNRSVWEAALACRETLACSEERDRCLIDLETDFEACPDASMAPDFSTFQQALIACWMSRR